MRAGYRGMVLAGWIGLLAVLGFACRDVRAEEVVALVRPDGPGARPHLPVYAVLPFPDGGRIAVIIVERGQLGPCAEDDCRVLARHAPGARYYLAEPLRPGARQAKRPAPALYDDGTRVLLADHPGLKARLEALGYAAWLLPDAPVRPAGAGMPACLPRGPAAKAGEPDVCALTQAITREAVMGYVGGISGLTPLTIGGVPVFIPTRYVFSGEPLDNAVAYAFEHLAARGLNPAYAPWLYDQPYCGHDFVANRNVVGELQGTIRPEEVVVVAAHLDDMPWAYVAPGADDDGSGCAVLFAIADAIGGYRFERTIRLVFFTGEEDDYMGSRPYARDVADAGQHIVAVLNLDMIGYDSDDDGVCRLHGRLPDPEALEPGPQADRAIARAFMDTAAACGLPLAPKLKSDGYPYSDHSSFWLQDIPAILVAEDEYGDFNQHYHTVNDSVDKLNPDYLTAMARAVLGATARLAGFLGPIPPDPPDPPGPARKPVSPAVLLLLLGEPAP